MTKWGKTRVRRNGSGIGRTAAMAGAVAALAAGPASAANPSAYVLGNYPVEARGANAVAAKDKALADGEQAALRALLKRLVVVTAYNRLSKVKDLKVNDFLEGLSVRSERNSATTYIATLDFSFSKDAVRGLLRQQGIPFVDEQADPITLIPIYLEAGEPKPNEAGAKTWADAWSGLDAEHTLTPFKLTAAPSFNAGVLKAFRDGDLSNSRIIADEAHATSVVLAILEPDLAQKRLGVTLIGRDQVGNIALKRAYRLQSNDVQLTMELASVVSLGILEGRWKAVKAVDQPDSRAAFAGLPQPVRLFVEYRSIQQWQELRKVLMELPGVQGFTAYGQTTTGSDVGLTFPGGGAALADAVHGHGMTLLPSTDGSWVARPTY